MVGNGRNLEGACLPPIQLTKALLFTRMTRVATAITQGDLRSERA
jgi:hypothetical protein